MSLGARTLLVGALALVASVSNVTVADAQSDAKLGYINSERLFDEYRGFTDAEQAYQQELDGWMRELKKREDDLVQLESEFRAQEPMLSDERKREMETEFQRGTQEYEQFRQSIFGQGGQAQRRNQELLEPVLAEVQRAVEEVAEENEFDIIFDAVDGNIVYGSEAFDITEQVLDRLREGSSESGTETQSGSDSGGEGQTTEN